MGSPPRDDAIVSSPPATLADSRLVVTSDLVEGAATRAAARAERRIVIHLVPHTHWDREWYLPWQRFRMRLVDLVDGLLDEMASDERVRFTLDGQTATVDDYLEIRPEREPDVRQLVADGRLAVGPWRILMDEFLVSGETIVRNLQMGLTRATELGRAMTIGYLPDMFGHVAQMPQILRAAGIGDAVVWRGVPSAIDEHAFTWTSPDGSSVRCEYLLGGYGNGREVLAVADRVGPRLESFVALQAPSADGQLLAMYGEDHSVPRPGYADLVAAFNESQDRFEIRIETLPEALDAISARSAPSLAWTGELRSAARANILMGVTSHRVEVKQAAGRVERLLERTVEPLWALHGDRWPGSFLDQAWSRVVQNSAHDSICACSSEATVAQVLLRYAEAEQVGSGLIDRLLADLARDVPRDAFVVVNPTPAERADLVELDAPATGLSILVDSGDRPVPTQEDAVRPTQVFEVDVAASEVVPFLRRRLHGRELFGYQVCGCGIATQAPDAGPTPVRTLTVDVDIVGDPDELDVDALLDRIAAEVGRSGTDSWRIVVTARPRRRLLARATIPPLGTAVLRLRSGNPGPSRVGSDLPHPVVVGARELSNGLVRVVVADDGTFGLTANDRDLPGVGRIVDGGDAGDSYNYAPPAADRIVEVPREVRVEPGRSGPLVGELRIRRVYDWPAGLLADASGRTTETIGTAVDTLVELRAGEPFVRVAVAADNRSLDHRVRFHLPIPGGADRSLAEGQFAVVERGLVMEGGHGEVPLPTRPAHGFVAAGEIAVLLEHVTEYELLLPRGAERASEMALTLVRATGLISRNENAYREEPAGPVIAAPTGEAQGHRRVAFALLPLARGAAASLASIHEAAERYRHELRTAPGSRPGGESAASAPGGPGLAIDGDSVVLSSLRRRSDAPGRVLELRVVHEAGGDVLARIAGSFDAWRPVDVLGRLEGGNGAGVDAWASAPGRLDLFLRGWEIRTIQLRATTDPA
ncbi:MAG TPA: hypothetical protein VGK63_00565 [Candidatus Limnocylindrales bacterium]